MTASGNVKLIRGCRCKRSRCKKKYCECYAGKACPRAIFLRRHGSGCRVAPDALFVPRVACRLALLSLTHVVLEAYYIVDSADMDTPHSCSVACVYNQLRVQGLR